ncbi:MULTISPECIES: peptidoglycan-associated lipoprotein Pal [Methylovorus]|uniref:Peptidoglycan-associated lipoprotein n=1 Tax=Methylovorus glucosotrophus (strain SIP3-4) TaxID=582744 RepID=C6XA94_METGS|nr:MULTISPECIES: peptidoglycan-associated lipoprotein Pal [Methylovorus]ACT51635.1 peptidoglycan-associated lipoprotein [Methylovorus glucosotrophus SIP3-4]ADQ85480.1 peptidoglycan-associated lipoprotein [Methylovorus sp. MP688]MCB4810863.1 peptidoglycan-associated lipoprotein Pal [Methylovorus menthalis]MCB5207914.1 peptidoglycan-associated lipoprotein Pal [Methylovorus mays]
MNKSLVTSVLLAMMLAACSSKPVKNAPVVEDKSPAQTTTSQSSDSASTSGVQNSSMSVNPLTDPNNILSKRSVYFDFDKDEVKPEYRDLVNAHAKYLVEHPDAKVILQGNTDERGTREYNLALGQRRAVAVKQVLNLQGVSDKQIETISYGEEKPQAAGSDEAAYSKNRRADIVYQGE